MKLNITHWPILLIEDTLMLIFSLHLLLVTELSWFSPYTWPGLACFGFSASTPLFRLSYTVWELYEAQKTIEKYKERLAYTMGKKNIQIELHRKEIQQAAKVATRSATFVRR